MLSLFCKFGIITTLQIPGLQVTENDMQITRLARAQLTNRLIGKNWLKKTLKTMDGLYNLGNIHVHVVFTAQFYT